jgi:catechol 2,3-dioxygenase-like lactoylglutathione lyase family enzyme
MTVGVRHTGIVVQDLAGAIEFWVDELGFKIDSNHIEEGEFIDKLLGFINVKVNTVKLIAPDSSMIELLKFTYPEKHEKTVLAPNSNGITHVALNIDDLDGLLERLSKRNYFPINSPLISQNKKVKVCYLRAHESILIELVETRI